MNTDKTEETFLDWKGLILLSIGVIGILIIFFILKVPNILLFLISIYPFIFLIILSIIHFHSNSKKLNFERLKIYFLLILLIGGFIFALFFDFLISLLISVL